MIGLPEKKRIDGTVRHPPTALVQPAAPGARAQGLVCPTAKQRIRHLVERNKHLEQSHRLVIFLHAQRGGGKRGRGIAVVDRLAGGQRGME